MRRWKSTLAGGLLVLAAPVAAQLGLPSVQLPGLPGAGDILRDSLRSGGDLLRGSTAQVAETLRQVRVDRIDRLLSSNRATIERDAAGEPARRGVLLLIEPTPGQLEQAKGLGFMAGESRTIEGLDLAVTELLIPQGLSLSAAQKVLEQGLPGAAVASDQLYFQSGTSGGKNAGQGAPGPAITATVGFVDGAPAQAMGSARGFAKGAPVASDHGSAVVSLAQRAGIRNVLVADVYGTDPAGGNALAIAQGLGWLVSRGVKVVSISLVGPQNPLLRRAIDASLARGVVIIAAVGNDGPAAPPSYPASYPGVIAVTAVDKRNRPLIEAGRALHLDYAAPGADLRALDKGGRAAPVRGTSFAVPLVAARAALMVDRGVAGGSMLAALDREAIALSRRIPDPQTGRGLICGTCR